MEKTSYQEKEVSTSNTKRGQYSPRRKDTAPKVNPQLAVELIFQEIKRIEAFTKRIEDATQRKVQIDEKSLENAENSLKSVLSGFEKQSYRMKNGGYVDKRISLWTILCAVFSLLFACLMCYLWVDAAKDRDNYKMKVYPVCRAVLDSSKQYNGRAHIVPHMVVIVKHSLS